MISPYGGRLINLVVDDEERRELAEYGNALPSLQLSPRSVCDLELLAVGAFSPLDRILTRHLGTNLLAQFLLGLCVAQFAGVRARLCLDRGCSALFI